MRIKNITIGQLLALRQILLTKNLSTAAEKCATTQPGMSATLKKLRNTFEDELITQTGNHMELTYFGKQLLTKLDTLFEDINSLMQQESVFDIMQLNRHFVIAVPSFLEGIILELFLKLRSRIESNITFEIFNLTRLPSPKFMLEKGIDIYLGVVPESETVPETIKYKKIHQSTFCYAVSSSRKKKKLDEKSYLNAKHILTKGYYEKDSDFLRSVNGEKYSRKPIGYANNIDALFQTQQVYNELVITAPKFVFNYYRTLYQIDYYKLPFTTPPCHLIAAWHVNNDGDPSIGWLIKELTNNLLEEHILPYSNNGNSSVTSSKTNKKESCE